MAENFGASFSIDVTKLKAGLTQANRLIKESESEFKAAAAGLGDWTKSSEGLESRIKYLNSAIDLQQKKVDAMTESYEDEIRKGLDPASARAVQLRTAINNEQTALNKNKAEVDKQTKALDKMADGADDASDSIEDVGDSAEDAEKGIGTMDIALGNIVANGFSALVGACKDAIGNLLNLATETQHTRTQMAKLETAFTSSGKTADDASETYKSLFGILADEDKATETASFLAKYSDDEKELATQTRILTGVFAEYGDSIPTEGLAEGIAASISMSNVQGVLADALEWQGINLDDFNEKLGAMATEQEREAYITETLNGLYGESADAYKEINGDIIEANEAQADFTESQAKLGKMIQPIATIVSKGFNKILDKVLELVEDVDFENFGKKVEKAFDVFINDVMPKVEKGLQWILDNKDYIIAGIVGIGAAFAAFKVVTLIQGVVSAMKGMTLAQYALNLAMSLNPVGLVVAAIAGLIAIFVVLWKKSDAFRNFWINLWDSIKKVCLDAWDAIDEYVIAAWEAIKVVWDVVVDYFKMIWNNIKLVFSVVKSVLSGDFKGAWDAIKQIFANVKTFFSSVWNKVKEPFSSVGSWFSDKFNEAWRNIKSAFSSVGSFFGGIWDTIVGKFRDVGTKVGDAIGGAFKTAINAVIRTVENSINFVPKAINKALDLINALPGVNISHMPTISLPRLAEGGIVNRATAAVVGEAGAEAIMPLENNTEWMDKLADKIAAKSGTGVVVNQTNNYSQVHSRNEIWKSKQQTAQAVRLVMKGVQA